MGLFNRDNGRDSDVSQDATYRGGCAEHNMRGPARTSMREAGEDAYAHGRRMHGSADFYGAYVEADPK